MGFRHRCTSILLANVASLCLAPSYVWGQRYSFRNYAQQDGLTNPNIRSLAQDGRGFVWAATRRGLYRYDGERFEEFTGKNVKRCPLMQSIKTAPDGSLWVSTRQTLVRLVGTDEFPVSLPPGVVQNADQGLDISPAGDVFTATNRGILEVRAGTSTAIWMATAPRQQIYSLHYDADGTLWFGAGQSVNAIRRDGVRLSAARLGLPSDRWTGINHDRSGALWIRSASRLMVLRPGARSLVRSDQGLPRSRTMAVIDTDLSGNIYIPTDSGIAFGDATGGGWRVVSRKQGLNTDTVTAMIEDHEGSVWLGFSGGGAARWLGFGEWASWTRDEGLASDMVWAVQERNPGEMWVGTDAGITLLPLDGRHSRTWSDDQGLSGNHVRAIRYAPDGNLWIASAPGTISILNPRTGSIRSIGRAQGLETTGVYTIAFSGDEVYLGTMSGIFRANLQAGVLPHFTRETVPQNDPNEMVIVLAVDHVGRIWAAGSQGVLLKDGVDWRRVTNSSFSGDCYALAVHGNDVWAGFADRGVARITAVGDQFRFERFDRSNGLVSSSIYVIGIDRQGRVWVGGDAGVDIYDGARWTNMSMADGLAWNDTDAGAFYADSHGGIWIGTSRGLSRYTPSSVRPRDPDPAVTIERIGSNWMRSASGSTSVPLASGAAAFHFRVLTYKREDQVRFEYKLAPVDQSWTVSDQRAVRFPNLSPGNYQFELRVRMPDGHATPIRSERFRVPAPWWRSPFLAAFVVCLLAAVTRAVFRRRYRRLIANQNRLETAVRIRTSELEREKAELIAVREKLAERATRDGLTGLWNRAAIFEILEREVHRARRPNSRVAVMLADLDHFKAINDRFGHLAGDAVLVEVSRRISACMRSYDFAGRYGGEELLIVLADCEPEQVADRAEELRRRIAEEPIPTQRGPVRVTCSFGVAWIEPSLSAHELVERADQALYAAKRAGRNQVHAARPAESAGLVLEALGRAIERSDERMPADSFVDAP